jgi:hypothetical protein
VRQVTDPAALRAVARGKSLEAFLAEMVTGVERDQRLSEIDVSSADELEFATESYLRATRQPRFFTRTRTRQTLRSTP